MHLACVNVEGLYKRWLEMKILWKKEEKRAAAATAAKQIVSNSSWCVPTQTDCVLFSFSNFHFCLPIPAVPYTVFSLFTTKHRFNLRNTSIAYSFFLVCVVVFLFYFSHQNWILTTNGSGVCAPVYTHSTQHNQLFSIFILINTVDMS